MIKLIFSALALCLPFKSFSQVTLSEFNSVVDAFHRVYDSQFETKKELMNINPTSSSMPVDFWWNLNNLNASYVSTQENGIRSHNLYLLGGYARIKGMTIDGVAMTLCHELGHGIAGSPFKITNQFNFLASTEGQSDYFATRYCIKKIFEVLPADKKIVAPDQHSKKMCDTKFKNQAKRLICYRAFQALEAEKAYFKIEYPNIHVHSHTPDKTIATKINHDADFYPSPQCRLDTMIAGILENERPRCWWSPK